ncbi:syntaxin-18-like [Sycon ciliatum]|uniref:syntaxin-18-like n=1 Tax=Sycon ciliatum TaxID=27933 RepID=UPI0031F6AF15
MDQTTYFRAVIKAVRSQQRHQQQSSDSLPSNHGILPKAKRSSKSAFSNRAKDVVSSITQLREFLLEHRKDYVNVTGHLSSSSAAMTDVVREKIDQEAAQLIQTCQQRVRFLQQDVKQLVSSVTKQVADHQQNTLTLINAYLKGVIQLYSEQRAVRVRQLVEKQKLSRLETESSKLQPASRQASKASASASDGSFASHFSRLSKHWTGESKEELAVAASSSTGATAAAAAADRPPSAADSFAGAESEQHDQKEEEEDILSVAERMEFEQENVRLPHEMDLLQDDVKKIETTVMAISKLQEELSEHIIGQADLIDRVADDVVESTENVTLGNENMREAIKNNASWRVWIIFFLLMCSICLLFLDWYSG